MATYLRGGGSLNSFFFRRYFLNLSEKKYENWSTFAEVIIKIKVAHSLRHGVWPGKEVGTSSLLLAVHIFRCRTSGQLWGQFCRISARPIFLKFGGWVEPSQKSLSFEVTPLASLCFHGEHQRCVKSVHYRSLAYEVATALKFCRNIIKHSRSCRPRALGSMISAKAAREGGRSRLRIHFLKIHTVKS